MKDYLKAYDMTLRTVGPVFAGDGKKLMKKEYIYNRKRRTIMVPDTQRMYSALNRKRLATAFQEYILADENSYRCRERRALFQWLRDNNIPETEYRTWTAYELDCGDFMQEKGAITVATCQKDSYGQPYIPGSSIKGMLRTVLLAWEIMEGTRCSIEREDFDRGVRTPQYDKRKYLKYEIAQLECDAFHILRRKDGEGVETDVKNSINDCLSGLIIGDSDPISLRDMVLCQKIDENPAGQQNLINILRESVKPGTDIHFKLTIDTHLCPYSLEDIQRAVKAFNEHYYSTFLSRFHGEGVPAENAVWLGGGTGFCTKTVLYSLLSGKEAVKTASEIFNATLPSKIARLHRHDMDCVLEVSPHIVKRTRYKGKEYRMGECLLQKV